jgi:hypothetical protein
MVHRSTALAQAGEGNRPAGLTFVVGTNVMIREGYARIDRVADAVLDPHKLVPLVSIPGDRDKRDKPYSECIRQSPPIPVIDHQLENFNLDGQISPALLITLSISCHSVRGEKLRKVLLRRARPVR